MWTRDVSNAHRLAALLRAGQVYVNTWSAADPAAPFGGFKSSGIGREHGHAGLDGLPRDQDGLRAAVVELVTEAHPDDPVLDVALTHALLRAVAAGERPDTLRVFRPGPTVAFGKLDRLLPGIGAAWQAARELGYTPLVRLAGGQAAVYDERSLVIEHVTAEADADRGADRALRGPGRAPA